MSNQHLTANEINTIFKLYGDYGAEKLPEFVQMIWQEAYRLGHTDGVATGHALGYVKGWNERMVKEPERPKNYGTENPRRKSSR